MRLKKPQSAREIAHLCAAAAYDKKASRLTLLSVGSLTDYADYFLIASASSTRQVAAAANNIHSILKKAGVKPLGVTGILEGQWALLDFGSVVIHVFYEPVREYYDLESIWVDAPVEELDEDELAALLPLPPKRTFRKEGHYAQT